MGSETSAAATRKSVALLAICLVAWPTLVFLNPPMSTLTSSTGGQGTASMQAEEESCDISAGKWVREPRGPLYTSQTCPMMRATKNCQKHGKDPGHLYWRWQLDGCELPRFAPERFLDVVRGKRLAFVGDSLARNQMESLLCLLSQAETPTDVSADGSDDVRVWHFPAHDFTLMVTISHFIVHAVPAVETYGNPANATDIHLDRLDAVWRTRLPELDYAIFSAGNWFYGVLYLWEGGRRVGCVNCRQREANLTDLGMAYAIRRVFRAALEGVARCQDCSNNLVTFVRTFSVHHFEHGSWSEGGYRNRTRPLEERELSLVDSIAWDLRRVQREEVMRVRETTTGSNTFFGVLDVTKAMMLGADGHPNWHLDKRFSHGHNDCLHWCLPGPVDMWNDLLLQRLSSISRRRPNRLVTPVLGC